MFLYKIKTVNHQEMFLRSNKACLSEFIIAAEEKYTIKIVSVEWLGMVVDLEHEEGAGE